MFSGGEVKNIMPAICDTDKFTAGAEQDQCKALVEACAAKADEDTCNTGNISDNRDGIRDTLTDGDAASVAARKNYDKLVLKLTGVANNSAAEPAAEEAPTPTKKKKAAKHEHEEVEESEGEAEEKTTPVATHPFFKEKNFVAIVSGVYSLAANSSGSDTSASGSSGESFSPTNCARNRILCDGSNSGGVSGPHEWTSYGFQGELLFPAYAADSMQLSLGGLSGYKWFTTEGRKAPTFEVLPILADVKLVFPVGSSVGFGASLFAGWQMYFMNSDKSKSISNGKLIVKGDDVKDFGVLTLGGKADITVGLSQYLGLSLGVQFINGVDETATESFGKDARGNETIVIPADGRFEFVFGIQGAL